MYSKKYIKIINLFEHRQHIQGYHVGCHPGENQLISETLFFRWARVFQCPRNHMPRVLFCKIGFARNLDAFRKIRFTEFWVWLADLG